MPSASDELLVAQQAAGRPLRFDEYMGIALYGEHGFYTTAGRAGRRGDFITSPEIGPLFGAVLARWIESEFERLGRPDEFRVVEVGAGPGTLARSVLLEAPQWRDRYWCVEVSAEQRAHHPEGVVSASQMPQEPFTGVVIANELLDNLTFRLAVADNGWREALVEVGADGVASEVTVPAPKEWGWLPPAPAHGARVPIQQAAAAWVDDARRRLSSGTVLAFDYCTADTAMLARMAWRDWLRTYRGHERGSHYLRDVGLQDVTAQVCVDQLPEPTAVRSQSQFLARWGLDELVEEGREVWERSAATPNVHSLRMRSRIREAESLRDPAGLGGFLALEWRSLTNL